MAAVAGVSTAEATALGQRVPRLPSAAVDKKRKGGSERRGGRPNTCYPPVAPSLHRRGVAWKTVVAHGEGVRRGTSREDAVAAEPVPRAVARTQYTRKEPRRKNVYCRRRTTPPRDGSPPPLSTLLVLLLQHAAVTSHGRRPGTAARGRRTRRTARGRAGRRPTTPTATRRGGRDGRPRPTLAGRRGRGARPPPAVGRAAPARRPVWQPPAVGRSGTALAGRLAHAMAAPTTPPPPLSLPRFTQLWMSPPRSGRPWRSASQPTLPGP